MIKIALENGSSVGKQSKRQIAKEDDLQDFSYFLVTKKVPTILVIIFGLFALKLVQLFLKTFLPLLLISSELHGISGDIYIYSLYLRRRSKRSSPIEEDRENSTTDTCSD